MIPKSRVLVLFRLPPCFFFFTRNFVPLLSFSIPQFLQSTMHELVSSQGEIKITPELQYMTGQEMVRRTFQINFGQVYLAKPTAREKDGWVTRLVSILAEDLFLFFLFIFSSLFHLFSSPLSSSSCFCCVIVLTLSGSPATSQGASLLVYLYMTEKYC